MIVRLRSRDGLERIEVQDSATVAGARVDPGAAARICVQQPAGGGREVRGGGGASFCRPTWRVGLHPFVRPADLKTAIHEKLNIPYDDLYLSKDAGLLTAVTETQYS